MQKKELAFIGFTFLCIFHAPILAHSPHDFVPAVAVSPLYESDRTVLCSLIHNNTYILKSTDGGITWIPSQIGIADSRVRCFAFSPDFGNDNLVFAGTEEGIIFKSNDRGASWASHSSGLPKALVTALAVSPLFVLDRTIYAATKTEGIYKSENGGETWTPCNTGLGNLHVNTLSISPSFSTDQTLFAGTNCGLFKSIDRGMTWFDPVRSDSLPVTITALALSPGFDRDQALFAGVDGYGIYKSVDGGAFWERRSVGFDELHVNALTFSTAYATDKTLFAASRDNVYRCNNDGSYWFLMNDGLDKKAEQTNNHYFGFALSPAFEQDRTVFLASWEGVHKTKASATAWWHLNVFNQNLIRDMAISPDFGNDRTIFAGAYGGGVYRSQDGGEIWEATATGLRGTHISGLATSPDYGEDETVFAGNMYGVEKSADHGDFWICNKVNPDDFIYIRSLAVSPDYESDCTLFAANGSQGEYALYKTEDGGESYAPLNCPFDQARGLTISPSFGTDQTLFATTRDGIYRSRDGGFSWENRGPWFGTNYSCAISPDFQTDEILFAGTNGAGFFKSPDGGDTWYHLSADLDGMVINALGVSPQFTIDQTLFAATKSHGVFRSVDGGATWSPTGLHGIFLLSLVLSPSFAEDQTVFLGAWDGVYRTCDAGASWERVLDIHRWDNKSEFVIRNPFWSFYISEFASASHLIYSGLAKADAWMAFTGHSVSWIGERAPFGGIASVYVDGQFSVLIDLYSPQMEWQQVLFTQSGFGPGLHHIYIKVTGTKNPASTACYVFIDAFEVGY